MNSKKIGPISVRREDLQQNLGHLPLLFANRDCAFAIEQDAVALQPRHVLAVARYTLVHALVVSGRRRRHEAEPVARSASMVV